MAPRNRKIRLGFLALGLIPFGGVGSSWFGSVRAALFSQQSWRGPTIGAASMALKSVGIISILMSVGNDRKKGEWAELHILPKLR